MRVGCRLPVQVEVRASARQHRQLRRPFQGKDLGKGVIVEIDVSTPGASTQVFKLTTRSGKKQRLAAS